MAAFTQAREAQTLKHQKKPLVRSWQSGGGWGGDEVAGGETGALCALIMEAEEGFFFFFLFSDVMFKGPVCRI